MNTVNQLREAAEAALNLLTIGCGCANRTEGFSCDCEQQVVTRLQVALTALSDAEWADRDRDHACEGAACCDPGDARWPAGRPAKEEK